MKALKDAYFALSNIFSKQFYFLASLASIITLIILFVKESNAVWIALSFFCVLIFAFTCTLIYTLFRLINLKEVEFESKSTFVKYETTDAHTIIFEVYKLIQSKKAIITEHLFNFKWTGSAMPVITSELQSVSNTFSKEDSSVYDNAVLKFNRPIYYNENEVVHFKAVLDDTDKRSEPYVSNRIMQEVDIIHYRIILKHKPADYCQNAFLERKMIDSITNNFTTIKEIAFDPATKSYEHHLLKPELGYVYRIRWEK